MEKPAAKPPTVYLFIRLDGSLHCRKCGVTFFFTTNIDIGGRVNIPVFCPGCGLKVRGTIK